MLNWNKCKRNNNTIDLIKAFKLITGEHYDTLAEGEIAMIEEVLGEIETFMPIHSRQAATVALVCTKQLLIFAQVTQSILDQIGIVLTEKEEK
jgi:hypothetical protein